VAPCCRKYRTAARAEYVGLQEKSVAYVTPRGLARFMYFWKCAKHDISFYLQMNEPLEVGRRDYVTAATAKVEIRSWTFAVYSQVSLLLLDRRDGGKL